MLCGVTAKSSLVPNSFHMNRANGVSTSGALFPSKATCKQSAFAAKHMTGLWCLSYTAQRNSLPMHPLLQRSLLFRANISQVCQGCAFASCVGSRGKHGMKQDNNKSGSSSTPFVVLTVDGDPNTALRPQGSTMASCLPVTPWRDTLRPRLLYKRGTW